MEHVSEESDSLLEYDGIKSINAKVSTEDDEITPSLSQDLPSFIYLPFIIFASGSSYLLLDGMYVQLPYFQLHQPEGITMGNKMTVASVMPVVTVLPLYFIILNTCTVSWRTLIYALIIIESLSCLCSALFWSTTINDTSIVIHLVTFISSFVGTMMTVATVPYFTSINNKLSAALFTGINLGSLFVAVIGLIQQPGNSQPVFGPTVYYLILIPIFILSVASLMYIDCKFSDMRNSSSKQHESKEDTNRSFISRVLSTFVLPVWWKDIWKYTAFYAYIYLVTWVFIRASLPFAAKHTSETALNDNVETLQYAIELSFIAVVLGSILAMFVKIESETHFVYFGALYTLISIIFFWITLDENELWTFSGSNEILVSLVFVMRLLDGYLAPLIYEKIDKLYPEKSHEMNQWINVVANVVAFIGTWIAYFITQYTTTQY